MVAALPATHRLVAELPQIALSVVVDGVVIVAQAVPLYRVIVPEAPTAKTLLAAKPNTPRNAAAVFDVIAVNPPAPSLRRIVPPSPTANTSPLTPHTPRSVAVPTVVGVHEVPLPVTM